VVRGERVRDGLRALAAAVAATCLATVALGAAYPPEEGRAVVATDHRLASEAGVEVLAAGGNAADAAVAAALAAGVVQPAGSGLGGGGFALVVEPDGQQRLALDFREVAPEAAVTDLFRTPDGGVDPQASRVGGLAVAVPGESRGLARLLTERGRLTPQQVVAPALRHARDGFPVGAHLARALGGTDHPAVRRLFTVGGAVADRGVRVRNPALARTLRDWAATGGEALHTGAQAVHLVEAVRAADGILTARDLAAYRPARREPVVARFGEHTLVTFPPPSSGGIALAQILGALEGRDLAEAGHNSAAYLHLLTEAMKHAFADRAHHLGDPDFVEVPRERLLSSARIAAIREGIDPERTHPPAHYGDPIAPPTDGGTQHISVLDSDGMAVALTSTINTSFGSGVVPPELGIPLNNEMDDFAAAPGVPNAYGLVGASENAIAPGKRPLSSMTPTVVLDAEGRPVMVLGASGGSFIISATLQVYLNLAVFDMDPQAAVSAPRIHHQWLPDRLFVEPDLPVDVRAGLEARGHTLDVRPGFSAVQAAVRTEAGFAAGSDPRKAGRPAALR
jgi:gamma-glutamyltranspeptidase / glutathione hydrolase